MVITEHPRVQGTGSSPQINAQNELSGLDKFWIVFAFFAGPLIAIVPYAFGKQRVAKKALKWGLIGWTICIVLSIALVMSFALFLKLISPSTAPVSTTSQSTTVGQDATPTNPVPTGAESGGSTAGSQSAALTLPAESESDDPTVVVNYVMANIWWNAFLDHQPAYFSHVYANEADVETAVQTLSSETSSVSGSLSITNVDPTPIGTGEFSATFDQSNNGYAPGHRSATFVWEASVGEWRIIQLQ